MKTVRYLIVLAALSLASGAYLTAQTSQGRILGTVTDSSGALVTGAKITITSRATNVSQTVMTTSSGDYLLPNVDPGAYTVAAEAKGFKKSLSSVFTVDVARDARVNMQLQPGAVSETVEVTAQQTLVDSTETTLNG
jgi:hypothetical protein